MQQLLAICRLKAFLPFSMHNLLIYMVFKSYVLNVKCAMTVLLAFFTKLYKAVMLLLQPSIIIFSVLALG